MKEVAVTDWSLVLSFVVFLASIIGVVWGHSLWLQKQFNSLKDLIYSKVGNLEDNLLSKLEYHEKHDDKRFLDLYNRLWEIRLRNAAIQGINLDNKISPDENKPL